MKTRLATKIDGYHLRLVSLSENAYSDGADLRLSIEMPMKSLVHFLAYFLQTKKFFLYGHLHLNRIFKLKNDKLLLILAKNTQLHYF